MNELVFMKALGDIPDELVKCYFDENDANTPATVSSDSLSWNVMETTSVFETSQETKALQRELVMKKGQAKKKASSIHFSRISVAAVVAACIGLNAALIFGISRMKNDSGALASCTIPEIQNLDQLYMELVDAMPTGVAVTYQNRTEDTCELPLSAEIWQNGKRIESITVMSDASKTGVTKALLKPNQSSDMLFSFDELPPGTYTLMTLDKDEKTLSEFGSIDFEISAGYMEMIHIPDMTGMLSETAISQLNDLNIAYDIVYTPRGDDKIDYVVKALPTPYKTVSTAGVQQEYYHYDGNGYWIKPTDRVQLEIAVHDERGPVMLPDMTGWDYERAIETILNLNLHVYKTTAYDDEVPEGKIISIDPKGPVEVDRYTSVYVVMSLGADDNEMHSDEAGTETIN